MLLAIRKKDKKGQHNALKVRNSHLYHLADVVPKHGFRPQTLLSNHQKIKTKFLIQKGQMGTGARPNGNQQFGQRKRGYGKTP